MKQQPLKESLAKFNYYAFLLFAFSLNFPQPVIKYTMSVWLISCLFVLDFNPKITIKKAYHIPMLLLLILMLGRVFVSFIHEDFESLFGKLFDTQIPVFVLPLILVYHVNRYFNLKQVLKVYIAGCLVSCIVLVVYFYLYRFNVLVEATPYLFSVGVQVHNFSQDFILFQEFTSTFYKHRAAIGINLSMCVVCLIYMLKQSHRVPVWRKMLGSFIALFVVLVLYASGSRSGFISFFVLLVFGLIYLFSRRKRILSIAFFTVLAIIIGLSSLKTTRPLLIREISSRDYSEIRNTDPRFQIWETCVETIRQNPVIGVGHSQVKKELFQKYKERGLEVDLREKYNSHNQFFQFALESGIWASLIFGLLLLPVFFGRNIFYLSMAFSSSFFIYSLFEDSFLTINGVSFFVFFMVLLTVSQKKKVKPVES